MVDKIFDRISNLFYRMGESMRYIFEKKEPKIIIGPGLQCGEFFLKCSICGCVFSADRSKLYVVEDNSELYEAFDCPRCGSQKITQHHKKSFTIKNIPGEKKEPVNSKVLYLCDRKACENCNPDCRYTHDISHAISFRRFFKEYMEVPHGEATMCPSLTIKEYMEVPHGEATMCPSLTISESYILGFDFSPDDDAVLSVIRQEGNNFHVEKVIVGREAEEIYTKLTNKSLERGKENE